MVKFAKGFDGILKGNKYKSPNYYFFFSNLRSPTTVSRDVIQNKLLGNLLVLLIIQTNIIPESRGLSEGFEGNYNNMTRGTIHSQDLFVRGRRRSKQPAKINENEVGTKKHLAA